MIRSPSPIRAPIVFDARGGRHSIGDPGSGIQEPVKDRSGLTWARHWRPLSFRSLPIFLHAAKEVMCHKLT